MRPSVFLFCLLIYTTTFAQTWVPGNIILKNQEKIDGYIRDYSNWDRKSVEFSRDAVNTTTTYDIADIDKVHINESNVTYLSRELDIDKKPIDGILERDGVRRIVHERILVKELAVGAINLFGYKDERNKHHFFIQKGDTAKIVELAYVRYLAAGKLANMPFYQNELRVKTADCNKIKTTNIPYEERYILKLIQTYNSCFDEAVKVTANTDSKLTFTLQAGFFKLDPTYTSKKSTPATKLNFEQTNSFNFGIVMGLIGYKKYARVVPEMELFFLPPTTLTLTKNVSSFRYKYTVDLGLRNSVALAANFFVLPKGKFSPYLRPFVGVTQTWTYTSNTDRTDPVTNQTVSDGSFLRVTRSGFMYGTSVGLRAGRFMAEAKYATYTNKETTKAKLVIVQLGLNAGYIIGQ